MKYSVSTETKGSAHQRVSTLEETFSAGKDPRKRFSLSQPSELSNAGRERYAERSPPRPPSNAVECVLVDRTQSLPVCDGLRRVFYTG